MAKYRRKTRLPPELQDPIVLMFEPGLVGPMLDRVQNRYVEAERLRKMRALAEYYGLDPDDPASRPMLAYRLALDHVPGMKTVAKARGRPKRNTERVLLTIYYAIEEIRNERRSDRITEACVQFAKTADPEIWGRHPASYYEARYHEGRRLAASVEGLARLFFG